VHVQQRRRLARLLRRRRDSRRGHLRMGSSHAIDGEESRWDEILGEGREGGEVRSDGRRGAAAFMQSGIARGQLSSLEKSSASLWFSRAVRAMHGKATRWFVTPADEASAGWHVDPSHFLLFFLSFIATDAATKMAWPVR
jgi:hypothetical protein